MSKSFVRSIKNVANGYSSVQVLVRNATSNDASGPTKYDMEEISALTYQSQTDFLEIMDMLDRRLNDKGKNWRHVAKSLTVLDYLVRFGSEKCVLWARDNLYIVKTLREFIHIDEGDNDQGALIRVKAKELVSLLRDDERLKHERELAAKSQDPSARRGGKRERSSTNSRRDRERDRSEPYDDDLQQALELSRLTAEEEQRRLREAEAAADPDLEAALRLSMEEEEMRRQKKLQNENLLDLSDEPPQQQYYMVTGYQQQPQQQQQYDMFGNPISNPYYQQQQQQLLYQQQQQQQQQQQLLYQQQLAAQQQQYGQPQFTGFNYQPAQQQQPLQPLKTGSNNPFALQSEQQAAPAPQQPSLSALAEEQQQQQQQQPQFFTQPQQAASPLKQQNTSSSKFNDSTHSELNNLLAQGTGIDTFGNTGASRIPHQHTKTQQFISSSGTGIKPSYGDVRLTTNATGNPFLNTGIGYQGTQQPQQQAQPAINPAYTGYGFGNAPPQQQQQQRRNGDGGPSLIDI